MKKIILLLQVLLIALCANAKVQFYSPFDIYVYQKAVQFNVNYFGYPISISAAKIVQNPTRGNATMDSVFQIQYKASDYNVTDYLRVAIDYYEITDSTKTSQKDTLDFRLNVLAKSNALVNFYTYSKIYSADFYNYSYADSPVLKYIWDFGDGNTSNDTSPTHKYSAGGDYQVCLSLLTKYDTAKLCMTVEVYDSNYLKAEEDMFYFYYPDSAQSFDLLANDVYYGKPTLSIIQQPKNATLTLDANNKLNFSISKFENYGYDYAFYVLCKNGNCDTAKINIATVLSPKYKSCVPSFSYITAKTKVGFVNTSLLNGSKSAIKYLWNFGDGDTSTAESPVHVYNDFGYYRVTLELTDSIGIKSFYTQYLDVNNLGCTPNFGYWSGIYKASFYNYTYCFDSTLKYVWDFGDGKTSNDENPVHNYDSAGVFKVCLTRFSLKDTSKFCNWVTVYDSNALNAEDDYLLVGNKLKSYQIDLYSNDLVYKTNTFSIITQPQYGKLSILGDGLIEYKKNKGVFFQNEVFAYSICNNKKCDTAYVYIEIGIDTNIISDCTPTIKSSVTNLTASLSATVQCDPGSLVNNYYWSFGDGDTSWSQNTVHTYKTPGTYFVSLTIVDTNGNLNYSYQYVTLKDTSLNGGCVYANDDAYSLNVFTVYNTYNVIYNDLNLNFKDAVVKSIVDFKHGKGMLYSDGMFYWRPDSGFAGCDSMLYEIKDVENTNCVDSAWVKVCFEDLGISCNDSLYYDTSYACGSTYAPVCGCNGKEYANECEALTRGGVAYYFNGPCGNLPPIGMYNGDTSSTSVFKVLDGGVTEIKYIGLDPNKNPVSFKMFADQVNNNCTNISYDQLTQKIIVKPTLNCLGTVNIYSMVCDNWGYCSMDTLLVQVVSSLGVNKSADMAKLEVYPNPSNSYLTIKTKGIFEKKILIKDLTGKNILAFETNKEQYKIEVSALKPGMYLINVIDSKKSTSITDRFMKN